MEFKETCITRIQDDDHIGVYTSERKYINKIYKLKEQYPDEVVILKENQDGSLCVNLPYDWMPFPKPKTKRTLTEEQKQAASERMKAARLKKNPQP